MHPDRTVAQPIEEAFKQRRGAGKTPDRSEGPLQRARRDASETAGRFEGLAGGEVGAQGAEEWRGMLPWARAEERHYSRLESYMGWLKGEEGRTRYHALLEEELASLRG